MATPRGASPSGAAGSGGRNGEVLPNGIDEVFVMCSFGVETRSDEDRKTNERTTSSRLDRVPKLARNVKDHVKIVKPILNSD